MNKVVVISLVVLLATIGLSAYAYAVVLPGMSSSSNGLGGAGTGTLNIYLADAPAHNATLRYLLVNVTSVTLKYSSNQSEAVTTTSSSSSSSSTSSTSSSSSSSSTATATSSTTSSSSTSNPVESGFRFVYNVSSSVGRNVNLTKLQGNQLLLGATKAPAGNVTGIILNITGAEAFWTNGNHTQLKVVADGKLMINVHFTIQSNGTTNLTLDVSPGDIHISPGNMTVLRPVVHVTAVTSGPNGTQTTETSETQTESTSS
jgi:hypothetical protein